MPVYMPPRYPSACWEVLGSGYEANEEPASADHWGRERGRGGGGLMQVTWHAINS